MIWKKIFSIENVVTTSYDSFDKALALGLIVFYNQDSKLQLLNSTSYNPVCNIDSQGSSYYEVVGDCFLIKFGNTIKKLNIKKCSLEFVCETIEENIIVLNEDFCLGSTSKRKPRIYRNEIISTKNNNVVYKWDDNKALALVAFESNWFFIFNTKFNGDLFLMDIKKNEKVWDIKIDDGIPGRRYYQQIENYGLLVQKYFSVDKSNLLKIDILTGSILWEIENTLPYYTYEASTCMLYGIAGNTFEVIAINEGERKLQTEFYENIHILPHLTYYSNGLLYFSGFRDNNTPVFGAVNVQTGELEFTQEVEVAGEKSFRKGLDKPIVVGNRLYVKDSMNTLHIFEKE